MKIERIKKIEAELQLIRTELIAACKDISNEVEGVYQWVDVGGVVDGEIITIAIIDQGVIFTADDTQIGFEDISTTGMLYLLEQYSN
jgi:hypothetical protein